MWTVFMDMYSGGGCKLYPYDYVYIEAPKDEAVLAFRRMFGRDPEYVTYVYYGRDYSIGEYVSLEQASGYERGCCSLRRIADGRSANDDLADVKHLYLEEGEVPPDGYEETGWSSGKTYQTMDQYAARKDVLIVRADEIDEYAAVDKAAQ